MIEIISKDLITLHVALSKKGKHPRLIKVNILDFIQGN